MRGHGDLVGIRVQAFALSSCKLLLIKLTSTLAVFTKKCEDIFWSTDRPYH